MNRNDMLNASPSRPPGGRLPYAIALAVYAVIGGIAVYISRDSINPDGIAYIQIARHYAAGRLDLAVNGWFGPMMSWLLTPTVWLGANPIVASRIILLLCGAVFAGGVVALVRQLSGRSTPVAFALGLALALITIPTEITPDLMLAAGLTWYFALVARFMRQPTAKHAAVAALVGGLSYCVKGYALPLVLCHLAFTGLIAAILHRKDRPWYKLAAPLAVGLAATVATVLPWVVIISMQAGQPCISTTGRSSRSWGPLGISGPWPHYTIQAPREGRITVWENPAEAQGEWPTWVPAGTPLENQIAVIKINLTKTLTYLTEADLLAMLAVALAVTIVLSLPRVGPGDGGVRLMRLWAWVSVAIYLGGYIILWIYDRFTWGIWGLLAAMAVWAILTLRGETTPAQAPAKGKASPASPPAAWRRTAAAMAVLLLMFSVGWKVYARFEKELEPSSESQQGHWMRQTAADVKARLGPDRQRVAAYVWWPKGLYFSFWNDWTFLGQAEIWRDERGVATDLPLRVAPLGPTIVTVFDNPPLGPYLEQMFAGVPGLFTRIGEYDGGKSGKVNVYRFDPAKIREGRR